MEFVDIVLRRIRKHLTQVRRCFCAAEGVELERQGVRRQIEHRSAVCAGRED